jgi:hypothetical protein
MPKKFNIHDVISDLSGTSQDLTTVLRDYGKTKDDLTKDDRQQIYAHLFVCMCCGWWCEVGEQKEQENGDRFCEDCNEVDED